MRKYSKGLLCLGGVLVLYQLGCKTPAFGPRKTSASSQRTQVNGDGAGSGSSLSLGPLSNPILSSPGAVICTNTVQPDTNTIGAPRPVQGSGLCRGINSIGLPFFLGGLTIRNIPDGYTAPDHKFGPGVVFGVERKIFVPSLTSAVIKIEDGDGTILYFNKDASRANTWRSADTLMSTSVITYDSATRSFFETIAGGSRFKYSPIVGGIGYVISSGRTLPGVGIARPMNYTRLNNAITAIDIPSAGVRYAFTYNADYTRVLTATESVSGQVRKSMGLLYDSFGRLTGVQDSDPSFITSVSYVDDAHNWVGTLSNPLKAKTRFAYYSNGMIASIVSPHGFTSNVSYLRTTAARDGMSCGTRTESGLAADSCVITYGFGGQTWEDFQSGRLIGAGSSPIAASRSVTGLSTYTVINRAASGRITSTVSYPGAYRTVYTTISEADQRVVQVKLPPEADLPGGGRSQKTVSVTRTGSGIDSLYGANAVPSTSSVREDSINSSGIVSSNLFNSQSQFLYQSHSAVQRQAVTDGKGFRVTMLDDGRVTARSALINGVSYNLGSTTWSGNLPTNDTDAITGATATYGYSGVLPTSVSGTPGTITMSYDSTSRVKSIQNSRSNSKLEFTYDSLGQLKTSKLTGLNSTDVSQTSVSRTYPPLGLNLSNDSGESCPSTGMTVSSSFSAGNYSNDNSDYPKNYSSCGEQHYPEPCPGFELVRCPIITELKYGKSGGSITIRPETDEGGVCYQGSDGASWGCPLPNANYTQSSSGQILVDVGSSGSASAQPPSGCSFVRFSEGCASSSGTDCSWTTPSTCSPTSPHKIVGEFNCTTTTTLPGKCQVKTLITLDSASQPRSLLSGSAVSVEPWGSPSGTCRVHSPGVDSEFCPVAWPYEDTSPVWVSKGQFVSANPRPNLNCRFVEWKSCPGQIVGNRCTFNAPSTCGSSTSAINIHAEFACSTTEPPGDPVTTTTSPWNPPPTLPPSDTTTTTVTLPPSTTTTTPCTSGGVVVPCSVTTTTIK